MINIVDTVVDSIIDSIVENIVEFVNVTMKATLNSTIKGFKMLVADYHMAISWTRMIFTSTFNT